ncbi:MAG: PTS sugar transporter subunit IIA [Spirochaetota bacterium]
MGDLSDYTDKKYIIKIKSEDKLKAIEEVAGVFKDTDVCNDIESLTAALIEREEIMTTGIGLGIAIPHAKITTVKKISFAIGISENGIDFNAIDGEPVYMIVLVAAGEDQHKEYLKLLSKIMTVLKNEDIRKKIIVSNSPSEILNILNISA